MNYGSPVPTMYEISNQYTTFTQKLQFRHTDDLSPLHLCKIHKLRNCTRVIKYIYNVLLLRLVAYRTACTIVQTVIRLR